ncbi:ABC transporter ATP-binding protein [Halobellus sp. Atlit-31R]|nr:ABC transporter ATP-binding protein [Halobellus sp. Atlit-31R]
MTDDPVVTAADVACEYGPVSALTDVSASIDPGTVTVVVGPNGGGKSTFLRTLAGVATPTRGTISYPATDGTHAVGYLPQSFRPREDLTVGETVAYYDALVGGGPTPDELLDRVGLAAVADRPAGALSGGMRRLLGVAVAGVGDPDLVVLDEPTSGLDRTMTRRVFESCATLADDRCGVVVATHDLPTVEPVADRALLLDRGQLQADHRLPLDGATLASVYDGTVDGAADGDTTVRSGRRLDGSAHAPGSETA